MQWSDQLLEELLAIYTQNIQTKYVFPTIPYVLNKIKHKKLPHQNLARALLLLTSLFYKPITEYRKQ